MRVFGCCSLVAVEPSDEHDHEGLPQAIKRAA
jgi:hypothetical protein